MNDLLKRSFWNNHQGHFHLLIKNAFFIHKTSDFFSRRKPNAEIASEESTRAPDLLWYFHKAHFLKHSLLGDSVHDFMGCNLMKYHQDPEKIIVKVLDRLVPVQYIFSYFDKYLAIASFQIKTRIPLDPT